MVRKTNFKKTVLFSSIVASSIGTLSAPTYAQDGLTLEEIVVTAQRRAQNLNDVPIAVQAFSETMLEDTGVDSLLDIKALVPSATMATRASALTPYVRGIGSDTTTPGNELSVGVYIDDVYQSNPHTTALSFNNIERVEVLKGPQGTLFGRNTTGGVIQIVTKDPSESFTTSGSLSYGNYETTIAKLYASTGVAENTAADIAVYFREQGEGFGDNLTTGEDTYHTSDKAVRSKWLVDVSDDTQLRLSFDISETDTSNVGSSIAEGFIGSDGFIVFAGCVAGLGGDPAAPTPAQSGTCAPIATAGATQSPENHYDSFSHVVPTIEKENLGFSAKLNHSFDALEFVSITGYQETKIRSAYSLSATAIPFLDGPKIDTDYDTVTQELQLISEGDTVSWIIGAFYMKSAAGYIEPDGLTIVPFGAAPITISSDIEKESYSVFGELTVNLAEMTSLTLGGRWTQDDVEVDWGINGLEILDSDDWSEPTYRVVLDHNVTDEILTYLSYSRGYKSGSYNASAPGTAAFDPETIDAYEAGIKATLFDGRAQVNAATWLYETEALQVFEIGSTGTAVIVNAAEAEVKGFELDFMANITEQLQLMGGVTFIDHEFTSFPNGVNTVPLIFGVNTNTTVDLTGADIPFVSDFNATLGFSYDVPTNNMGTFRLGGNYYYSDGHQIGLSGAFEQPSYDEVSAYIAWTNPSENWGVRVFGNNLTDEETIRNVLESAAGYIVTPGDPLTWGVEVNFDF